MPLSPTDPPIYVQRRCDVVARIMTHSEIVNRSKVICLSAGTAPLPQYILPHTGLPLWESTASAAYLLHHPIDPVPSDRVYVETASYDTISNAFFARTVMTDIMRHEDCCSVMRRKPQRVLVVTNEFHVGRSKAIFDWIYGVPSSSSSTTMKSDDDHQQYEMFYLSCNNIGLTTEAIDARKAHEMRGEVNVRTKLSVQYKTLHDVWTFLTKEHDFYSASKLAERAMTGVDTLHSSAEELKLSYGKSSGSSSSPLPTSNLRREQEEGRTQMAEYKNGKIVLTLDVPSILLVVVASLLYSYVYK